MGGDHKCSVCQATFTRPQHVARHMRSHTGDRPYKCQHCGDQFARSDLLSRHVNKCHANEKAADGAAGAAAARRKGTATASRATTSKQACDQCVQSSLPCDGCNPCSKCVHRKCRCTYVKFHRQTAPSGPGHQPRMPTGMSPLPGSAPGATQLPFPQYDLGLPYTTTAGATGNGYSQMYSNGARPYGIDDNVLLGPVEALYAQQQPQGQPQPPMSYPTPASANIDYAAKFRAQQEAEFMRRSIGQPPSSTNFPSQQQGTYWPYAQPQPHDYSSDSSGFGSNASSFNGGAEWTRNRKRTSIAPGVSGNQYRSSSTGDANDWNGANNNWARRSNVNVSGTEEWESGSSGHGGEGSSGVLGRSSPSLSIGSEGSGYSTQELESKVQDPRTLAAFAAQHPQLAAQHPDVAAAHPEVHSVFGLLSLDDPAMRGIEMDDPLQMALNPNAGASKASEAGGGSGAAPQAPSDTAPFFSAEALSAPPQDPGATPMPRKESAREQELRELREFWKQYMRTPLTGPQLDALTPSLTASAGHATGFPQVDQNGNGIQQRPPMDRKRTRVNSMPSVKTPTTDFVRMLGEPQRQQTQPGHGNNQSQSHSDIDDLRHYEAAVMARNPPAALNLVMPRRERGKSFATNGSPPQLHQPQNLGFKAPQLPQDATKLEPPSVDHFSRPSSSSSSLADALKEEAAGGGSRNVAYSTKDLSRSSSSGSSFDPANLSDPSRPTFKRLASQTLGPANAKAARLEGDADPAAIASSNAASGNPWDALRLPMGGQWSPTIGAGSHPSMSQQPISRTATGGGGGLGRLYPERKIAGLPGGGVGAGIPNGGAQGIRVRHRRMSAPLTPSWNPPTYPWSLDPGLAL